MHTFTIIISTALITSLKSKGIFDFGSNSAIVMPVVMPVVVLYSIEVVAFGTGSVSKSLLFRVGSRFKPFSQPGGLKLVCFGPVN